MDQIKLLERYADFSLSHEAAATLCRDAKTAYERAI